MKNRSKICMFRPPGLKLGLSDEKFNYPSDPEKEKKKKKKKKNRKKKSKKKFFFGQKSKIFDWVNFFFQPDWSSFRSPNCCFMGFLT